MAPAWARCQCIHHHDSRNLKGDILRSPRWVGPNVVRIHLTDIGLTDHSSFVVRPDSKPPYKKDRLYHGVWWRFSYNYGKYGEFVFITAFWRHDLPLCSGRRSPYHSGSTSMSEVGTCNILSPIDNLVLCSNSSQYRSLPFWWESLGLLSMFRTITSVLFLVGFECLPVGGTFLSCLFLCSIL